MKRSAHIAIALLLFTAALSGCGKSESSNIAPPTPAPTGDATIRGTVLFHGTPPAPHILTPAGGQWGSVPDESVIVNPNGTLRNVIVYLKDAPPGEGGGAPVVLNQVNYQYIPHVLALQVGQPLIVRNSDHHMHNIHFHCQINPEMNFGQIDTGDHDPITFKAPEFFKASCDVHPWMESEIAVFDHPYFAVTSTDGSFEIDHIPAGTYTLVARHERFGELSQLVKLDDKQIAEISFTYQPPP
jgi:plastocyanin